MSQEMGEIQLVVSELKDVLARKMVKIGNKNGYVDLEFGVSGSSVRVRPPFEQSEHQQRETLSKKGALE